MKTEDFNYELDEKLIAQKPLKKRDSSRLLILNKENGDINHKHFYDIVDLLNKDDVLVMNDSRVIPARLFGIKKETKAVIEILLLKEEGKDIWECLVKPAKRIKKGSIVIFGEGLLKAECIYVGDDGIRKFKLIYEGLFLEILSNLGEMPLPPYIHEKLDNQERYQTVYAKNIGSAAAPTAGLHFTPLLLEKIKQKGVKIVYITLHVGLATFRPVVVDRIKEHEMHEEFYEMSEKAADILNNAKRNNKKIIAVGTTSVRTLETIYNKYNQFKRDSGWTNIFIYPPYKIKSIDYLITNFHLPKSTLLMLVSSLATKEMILKAYKEAVKEKYRFFSFGDAMFIGGSYEN